ncbi:uncharacterized protein LOC130448543 [Diorhabda sublineata]|uniref:uncharacterized protein LOC130448543 n=1 Tax=Diorhabda sublineata TaxID=1163346 RepID=UPI0024E17DAF|nr:uncharacterized protein LOC130448543 [Diorhabda sublineata]XP_056641925.1 uncharacterized protein LOC130448543 [Diorhabda sublineata]XP_056641926.1 uncharacterized protein LOC130448543 [Diorhabda sublineata]
MGVKLQLLLGLLILSSACGSEGNTTNLQNSEKIDSSKNIIEKLPKTDSQINLVNNDTHINLDNSELPKYSVDNDTHKNVRIEEDVDSDKNDDKMRQENSRSINLDRLASPDFHTNEYLSDNQKFIVNSIHKSSTKSYLDFSDYQVATPTTDDHDLRFEEAGQKLEQDYEEKNSEHSEEHQLDEDLDADHKDISQNFHIDTVFGNSKHNPNASLDYKERTKILKNNTFDDNSEHNRFSVVKVQKLNFASEYNVSTFDEDDTGTIESTSDKEKIETTSHKSFFTTRKPITLTKPPTSPNNHILNNKIESETIKAINSLTTDYPAVKISNVENEIISKEQNIDENKIIPFETTNSETVATEYSTITTEKNSTTEQNRKTNDRNNEFTTKTPTTTEQVETSPIDNDVTTTHVAITKTLKREDHASSTDENVHELTPSNTDETTETSTFTNHCMDDRDTDISSNKDILTTEHTELGTVSTSLLRSDITIEHSTVTPTTEDTTITSILSSEITSKISEETTNTPTDITRDTTAIIKKETAEDTTRVTIEIMGETTQETTQDITTESSSRVSKEFTFEDKTEKCETTTQSQSESQTEQKTDTISSTELETTTLELEAETEMSTNTFASSTYLPSTDWDTTTVAVKTIPVTIEERTTLYPVKENMSTINEVQTRENNIMPLNETSTSSFIPLVTDLPKPRQNESVIEEATTVVTTSSTDDYTSDSSSVPDSGNIGGIEDHKGKIAAIVISSVGAISLILLAGLLYIMRKRQKRFNYKQRCRPVSLDHYSVDNVSSYNSTRRKAERQSKRSYGNPAFDDPVVITHPLNLSALVKFASNTEDIKAEFEEIPQITARISELPDGCETKNRYANVIPLPETRVFLQPIDGYPNSDYINANYVTGPKNTKGYYIACQAPMQNTVDDFWRMVWEQQSKVILMITHLYENGVEKCVDYLPPSEVLDCNRLFGDFQVTLKKRDVKDKYIISNLQLKNMVSNSWREVTHFWYLGWPEKGVPTEENSLIAFLIEARSYMKSSTLDKIAAANGNVNGPPKNEINPVVVHCSPGTGRTGVVIACDIAIREFEQTRLVDIPKIVYRLRRDRASAVQTKEQYMLIYKVVSLYATKLTGGALESY